MKRQTSPSSWSRVMPRCCRMVAGLVLGSVMSASLAFNACAQPVPVSDLSFSEGSGLAATNAGSLGGLGTLAQQGGFPIFAPNAPVGPYAPTGNGGAMDFGAIVDSSDGARAVDFPSKLGPLNSFTVCGWVNCRDLSVGWGGNRIAFALVAENGSGFDLVHQADGALRLGVNQWPDDGVGGPISSVGRITADPNVGAANWVFFAVTYDGSLSSGQVNYYFGNAQTPAALDVTRDYNRGALPDAGTLTIGNFGTVAGARNQTGPGGNSRCFRGLFDEIRVYSSALTLEQILNTQTNVAAPPPALAFVSEPVDRAILAGQNATFSVSVTGGFPITYQWQRDEVDIPNATNTSYTLSPATVGDSGARFRVIVTNPINSLTSSNATLLVNSDGTPPTVVVVSATSTTNILVSFSESVELGSAQEPGAYILDNGNLNTYSAILQPNLTNVLLTTDLMATSTVYQLTILMVNDRALPVPNTMAMTNVTFISFTPPPLPTPIVAVGFDEGTGTATINNGSAGGSLTRSTPAPYWTNNVPPQVGGAGSVDFQTTTGNYFVESPTNYPQLAGLAKFTITGWLNNRSTAEGGGGNRIVAWNSPNSDGVDLVYHADGSLQMGINQWPDNVPARSSAAKITTDANADPANWRFFAVTYDSTLASDQVRFYFGNSAEDAALDVARTYARGVVGSNIRPFVVGHFNNTSRASSSLWNRMFRGLIDEVKVFGDVLTPEQVVLVQRTGPPAYAVGFALQPASQPVLAGQPAAFSVTVTGTPPISVQWQRDGVDIPEATGLTYTIPVATMADNGAVFRVAASNALGQVFSSEATLTVVGDDIKPTVVEVSLLSLTNLLVSFSEPVEAGSAQEPGAYVLDNGNLNTYSAVLQANSTDVLLTTDLMNTGTVYTLTIMLVNDRAVPTPNTMVTTNWVFTTPIPPPRTAAFFEARFEEGSGSTVTNSGLAGGFGAIDFGVASSVAGLPAFTNNVPVGPYAPTGNQYALFTGTGTGHTPYAGKAVDFPNEVRTNTVGLTQFTLTGWINVTDGTIGGGGNRIFSTWPQNVNGIDNNRLTGIDLVIVANGQLRLGINQAPDYPSPPTGPFSSANRVTIDANASQANWVFFAVTYDASLASDHVKYYFGNASTPVVLDVSASYPRGAVTDCTAPVTLTLANFMDSPPLTTTRDSASNSRAFRGLMDEIRCFSQALTLAEIQQIQTQSAVVAEPQLAAAPENGELVMGWESTGNFQLQFRTNLVEGVWENENTPAQTNGTQRTVRVPMNEPSRFYRLINR